EIFDVYVATAKPVDYGKYFAFAGLKIDTEMQAQPGAWLGAEFGGPGGVAAAPGAGAAAAQANSTSHVISRIDYDSPAARAGLSAQDEILAVDGTPAGARPITDVLKAYKPGDRVKLLVGHHGEVKDVEVVLGSKMQRSFKIQPATDVDAGQAGILR